MFYDIHMHDKQKSSSKIFVVVYAERTCALIKKFYIAKYPNVWFLMGFFLFLFFNSLLIAAVKH